MQNPFDKHRFAHQPAYYANYTKMQARLQLIEAYERFTGYSSLPADKGYWTLCNKQPDVEGAEIVQLVKVGFLLKNQFYGIDNDIRGEGIIDFNKSTHPEAHWFCGDWLEVIDDQWELFNPGLVYFDFTKTVASRIAHTYLARTLNLCPPGTMVAANLMLSDGHSAKRFDPRIIVEEVASRIRNSNEWVVSEQFFRYKSSRTEMGTYIFYREVNQ